MSKYLFIGIEALIERADPISQPFDFYYRPAVFQSLSTICSETDVKIILLVEENVTHDEKRLTEKISSDLIRQDILNEIVYSNGLIDIQNPLLSRSTFSGSYSIGLTDNLSNFAGERVITALNKNETINWKGIAGLLVNTSRIATVRRKTNETDITIQLNLDGNGSGVITTGLAFFDHMLGQVKRHGNLDLSITALGDLHIDEHHTIEDVGLALGEAFYKALGNKKGIERYGFLLPMDDCLAQVAIDFGGRPWLEWNVPFTREKIGDMPTEMFMHFFKSFSDNAKCNLNIKAEGSNEHHKIEAVFKAFAKAINAAVIKTGKNNIPSTKGSL